MSSDKEDIGRNTSPSFFLRKATMSLQTDGQHTNRVRRTTFGRIAIWCFAVK
jgi:hypothetical protein